MTEWHEDTEFWELLEPLMFNEERWEQAARDIPHIVKLLDLQPGDAILDMACGNGRYALPLARAGFRVTGVDPIPAYLEDGKGQAKRESQNIEFVKGDMRTFARSETFDAAIVMGTSFGIFGSDEEEITSIRNVFDSLVPGGRLLLETVGEGTGRGILPSSSEYEAKGLKCTETHIPRGDGTWVDSHLKVKHARGKNEYSYSYRVYTPVTMTTLLITCGFMDIRFFSDLSGSRYTPSSKKLFVFATK